MYSVRICLICRYVCEQQGQQPWTREPKLTGTRRPIQFRLKRALRNIILGVFGKDEYLWFSFMELKSSTSECLHFHGNVVTSANRFSMI